MLLLAGLGVCSSSLQGPGHPASMYNSGVNYYDNYFFQIESIAAEILEVCSSIIIRHFFEL